MFKWLKQRSEARRKKEDAIIREFKFGVSITDLAFNYRVTEQYVKRIVGRAVSK
ncbi:hypothetical protein [Megasphaera sueciensis]|uniref:hypothetical protein n=1 Tax=Megasphaera sueciensis TaxID=349094 RepID=UPI003D086950